MTKPKKKPEPQEAETTEAPLTAPLYKLRKGHLAGLRMDMLTMGEDGGVSTGTGLGSDAIWLEWKGEYYYVRGSELLRALVRRIDPKSADLFPEGVKEV